jgi:hypothetical protein
LEKNEVIQGMLVNGLDWGLIEKISHLSKSGYEALKEKYDKIK